MTKPDHKSPEEEKELILRIIRYVKQHHRVTLMQISRELKLDQTDHNFMLLNLVKKLSHDDNPNHILAFANRPKSNEYAPDFKEDEYQLVPTAIFSYVDYLEIKEARRAAADARHLSLIALQVAIWSLIFGVLIGLFGIFVQVLFAS